MDLLLFFLLIAQILAECQNPMFQDWVVMPSKTRIKIPLLMEPQTQTSFGSCSHYDNKPSCCNATSFAQIIADTQDYDYVLHVRITALSEIPPDQIVGYVVRCYNFSLNAKQYDLALQLATLFKTLLEPAIQCYGGFLGYNQGMLCFSCEPDWSNYYDANNYILDLTHNTCNSVYQACQWLENSIQSTLLQAVPIAIQLLQADDSPDRWSLEIIALGWLYAALQEDSICEITKHKDCQRVLCEDLLMGLDWGGNESVTCETPPALTGLGTVLSYMQQTMSSLQTTLAATTVKASPSTTDTPIPVQNEYSNSGYDAYNIGCNPSLSTYACPKLGSAKFDWKIVVIIGGSVVGGVVLLTLLVIICRRKRAAEAVALDDNVPKYNRLEDAGPTGTDTLTTPTTVVGQGGAIQ